MTLQVELVSPEEIVFTGEATMVIARTTAGEIAFLTGHVPFVGVIAGIDVARAQAARDRAEARLREKADDADAEAALARANLRLSLAGASTAAAH
jgi:F-type H+-transporting ATPase subunit epsilon